jgi:hypothetical protein
MSSVSRYPHNDAFRERVVWGILVAEQRRWRDATTLDERDRIAFDQAELLAGWESWPRHHEEGDDLGRRMREEWAAAVAVARAALSLITPLGLTNPEPTAAAVGSSFCCRKSRRKAPAGAPSRPAQILRPDAAGELSREPGLG